MPDTDSAMLADSNPSATGSEVDEHPIDQKSTDAFYGPEDNDDWEARARGEKPKAKVADDAPKGDDAPGDDSTAKPDDEPAPKNKAGFWDKGRQADAQEQANARRREDASQRQIAELTGLVKTMHENASQSPPDTAAEDADKEINALVASLNKKDTDGDLIANAEDIVKVVLKIREIDARTSASTSSKPSAALEEMTEKFKALSERMDARDADAERAESSATLNVMLDGFDKQYSVTDKKGNVTSGAYRNDAIESVREQLADMGFDEANLPHANHVRFMLDAAYEKAFTDDPKNKNKDLPKPKVKVLVDPGKGGSTIPTAPVTGDNDQVFADMQRSGEFD